MLGNSIGKWINCACLWISHYPQNWILITKRVNRYFFYIARFWKNMFAASLFLCHIFLAILGVMHFPALAVCWFLRAAIIAACSLVPFPPRFIRWVGCCTPSMPRCCRGRLFSCLLTYDRRRFFAFLSDVSTLLPQSRLPLKMISYI